MLKYSSSDEDLDDDFNQTTAEKEVEKKKTGVSVAISFKWDGVEAFFTIFFLFFGLFTRFWNLQDPSNILLSEKSTIDYISNYHKGEFFIDHEPELGKLLVSHIAGTMEYNGSHVHMGKTGFVDRTYVSLRSISAFPAALVVPLTFISIRLFGGSRFYAICGGLLCLVEPNLIAVARAMGTVGFIQLFSALSIMFCGISHHFATGTPQQTAVIVCQAICAGCAVSCDMNCLPFALFAAVWPLLRFKCKKLVYINVGIIISIMYASSFTHVVCTPNIPVNTSMSSYFTKNFANVTSKEPRRLKFAHFVGGCEVMIRHIFTWLFDSVHQIDPNKIERRMFICDRWIPMLGSHEVYFYIFNNRWFGIPAAIILWIEFAMFVMTKTWETRRLLAILTLLVMAYTSVCYEGDDSLPTCYLPLLLALVSVPLLLENMMPIGIAGVVMTGLISISLFMFIDWGPFLYGYETQNPFVKPHLKI